MKVSYQGCEYFVIGVFHALCPELDQFEIAPTQHGAGSFYVLRQSLDIV